MAIAAGSRTEVGSQKCMLWLLTCVPCQPTSKLPQAVGTGGGSSGGGNA